MKFIFNFFLIVLIVSFFYLNLIGNIFFFHYIIILFYRVFVQKYNIDSYIIRIFASNLELMNNIERYAEVLSHLVSYTIKKVLLY